MKALQVPSSLFFELELIGLLVDAAAEAQNREVLQEYLARVEALAQGLNNHLYLGIAHRGFAALLSLDGNFAAALERLDQAIESFTFLGLAYQLGRSHAQRASVLAMLGRNEDAQQALHQSLDYYNRLGATLAIEKTRHMLDM
ncbi:MAG: hypothetical protein HYU84_18420 [Chloroflexi bacterium]|nr:hypothetical protein [Chloroflexota bacterium]MBI3158319.1 hypothetical protein [Chloroflexota bacterium]